VGRGAIRNLEAFAAARWDWSFLEGCFGQTRISPSDIDACVERNGHFLWIENKPLNGGLDTGQFILLSRLRKRGDTVIILYGRQEEPPWFMQILPNPKKRVEMRDIRAYVSAWFNWADGTPVHG